MDDKVINLDEDATIEAIDMIIDSAPELDSEKKFELKKIILQTTLLKSGKVNIEDEKAVVEKVVTGSFSVREKAEIWNIWDKCKKEIKKLAESQKVAST